MFPVTAMVAVAVVAVTGRAAGLSSEWKFPEGFLLGAGSSAYQIEGAWNVSGKGLSNLDRAYSRRTDGGGNVACDSYHRFREDIEMLKLMGATHYRFSLAWARLLPTGESDNVNQAGVDYYNDLLDELEASGIEPVVTLYHMDVPAALDDKFEGWLSPQMVDYFVAYAVTAFRLFGGRVRYWVTLNEPFMYCLYGVGHGRLGAVKTWPGHGEYVCGHHMLLAHARAYRAYKNHFAYHHGSVGITLQNFFTRPCSGSAADRAAADAHQQFELGWFLEPLLSPTGDYPEAMRRKVDAQSAREGLAASRLPTFTATERKVLKGALDFLGLNLYFGWEACDGVPDGAGKPSVERDAAFTIKGTHDQFLPPGPFRSTPWSMRATLDWLRSRYGNLSIIITENGFGDDGAEGLHDATRVAFLHAHLGEVLAALHEDKHDVKGYFAWSLLDSWEWGVGFKLKFGVVHVDHASGSLRRTPKDSLFFLRDVIRERGLPSLPSLASGGAPRRRAALASLAPAAVLSFALAALRL
ncbi:myrosinase 1-like [Thrips palmi]|uniref:beta-glucosidase n=1 Tax=Thrips palmi TaxID=161013 RepID=A0A6P8ZQ02_THRPL|nr:myrosinase 1-like [Thrips palmi]